MKELTATATSKISTDPMRVAAATSNDANSCVGRGAKSRFRKWLSCECLHQSGVMVDSDNVDEASQDVIGLRGCAAVRGVFLAHG